MKNDDLKLDGLLRDVPLPDDWQNRIKGLVADQIQSEIPSPSSVSPKENWLDFSHIKKWVGVGGTSKKSMSIAVGVLVVTSVLLVIVVGVVRNFDSPPVLVEQEGAAVPPVPLADGSQANRSMEQDTTGSWESWEAELEQIQQQMKVTQAAWEVQQHRWLAEKIDQVEQSLLNPPTAEANGRALVMAAETALMSGLSIEHVQQELLLVVDRYPGTASAVRAAELLACSK